MNTNERERIADCICHQGSVCTLGCKDFHHIGCSTAFAVKSAVSTPIAPAELAEWQAVVEKATLGPWERETSVEYIPSEQKHYIEQWVIDGEGNRLFDADTSDLVLIDRDDEGNEYDLNAHNNLTLAALTRTALPRLIDEVEALRRKSITDPQLVEMAAKLDRLSLRHGEMTDLEFTDAERAYENTIADLIGISRRLIDEVEARRREIETLRNQMHCEDCGNPIAGDAVPFCLRCIKPLTTEIESLRSQLREAQGEAERLKGERNAE